MTSTSRQSEKLTRPENQADDIRARLQKHLWQKSEKQRRLGTVRKELKALKEYLEISGQVTQALQTLSDKLFNEVLRVLEDKLTIALQEVLGQPIKFKAKAGFKNSSAVVEFAIDRDGNTEDVYRGQGGSVQNVLSVGLRMFALATLEESIHRRFLVLDEQDCWLRPELVPKLVKIVHQAGRDLGFQVIMISHHNESLFEKFADRIYRFEPDGDSVAVYQVAAEPFEPDGN